MVKDMVRERQFSLSYIYSYFSRICFHGKVLFALGSCPNDDNLSIFVLFCVVLK